MILLLFFFIFFFFKLLDKIIVFFFAVFCSRSSIFHFWVGVFLALPAHHHVAPPTFWFFCPSISIFPSTVRASSSLWCAKTIGRSKAPDSAVPACPFLCIHLGHYFHHFLVTWFQVLGRRSVEFGHFVVIFHFF